VAETSVTRIAIDCDDTAIELKNTVYLHIKSLGISVTDLDYCAANKDTSYPEIGYNLALKIKNGEFERGILICGTGLGMAMIANKVEGVYAGVCHDVYSAERLRKSNDAQVLTMGARVIGPELAKTIIDAWLKSEFSGGGSLAKVRKMRELERRSFHPVN
jgi:ribose 5-phosphate isomerase B